MLVIAMVIILGIITLIDKMIRDKLKNKEISNITLNLITFLMIKSTLYNLKINNKQIKIIPN